MYFIINGNEKETLNTSKHDFNNREKQEMLFRLFGFSRVPLSGIVNAKLEDQGGSNYTDFTTNAQFDYMWLVTGVYTIPELTNDPEIAAILTNGLSMFSANVSNTNTMDMFNQMFAENMLAGVDVFGDIVSQFLRKVVCELMVKNVQPEIIEQVKNIIMSKFDQTTMQNILTEAEKSSAKAVTDLPQFKQIFNSINSEIGKIISEYAPAPVLPYTNMMGQPMMMNPQQMMGQPMMMNPQQMMAQQPNMMMCQHGMAPQPMVAPQQTNETQFQGDSLFKCNGVSVNLASLPFGLDANSIQQVKERLTKAFSNRDFVGYILSAQQYPLFNIGEYVNSSTFMMTSYSPGLPYLSFAVFPDRIDAAK